MILRDVRNNKIESYAIISVFVLFISLVLYYVLYYYADLGYMSAIIALSFSFLTAYITYYNSDKIVLSLNGARPATEEEDRLLTSVLDSLVIATGMPRPKLYVIDDSAPNAFATGRNPEHAVICFTTGLIDKLDKYEIEGVMAHELSHIKNYDILLSTVVSVFVGMVVILSDIFFRFRVGRRSDDKGTDPLMIIGLIALILSPIFTQLMQLALSRKREYLADASAVEITRNPNGLISALKKISDDKEPLEAANKTTASMYIVNPFKGKKISEFFATHPPIEKRIDRLMNIQ